MKLFRVSAFLLVAGALAACKNDTAGTLVTLPPLAGLRYVNVSPDTGALDFRIVDAVAYAPNQVGATFRTGGAPSGISTGGFLPLYQAVAAGSHEIRVFLSSTNPTVASTVLLDTTYTFVAGTNYSFYAYGYAKAANGTPTLGAVIVADTAPTLTATQFGLRVLNLAPSLAGNPAGLGAVNLDGFVGLTTSAVPIPGAPSFANMSAGNFTPYVTVATNAAPYRLAMTQTGTGTPVAIQATLPLGAAGNSITQPIPGTAVGGTVITAVLVPRSIVGSAAPQTAATSVSTNIDSVTRNVDTATVWRSITAATATACAAPAATGASANDILVVSGLGQPEYNGLQSIVATTTGTAQTLWSQRTVTTTGATGAFTLTYGGVTTAVLAAGATAAQVETALGALSTVGSANVAVSGAAGGPYTVLFMGTFTNANNATVGTLSTSASGGLTSAVTTPAVGCGTAALVTRDTISFTGAIATDSFKVTVAGKTTPALVVGATAATVQTAVQALTSVGSGNATVTGTGPYVVTFNGALNNQNVAASAAMTAGSTGVIAVAKAAYVFSGAATPSRFRYRVGGVPVSPATGAATFKIVTAGTADFTIPSILFMIDVLPTRTAP